MLSRSLRSPFLQISTGLTIEKGAPHSLCFSCLLLFSKQPQNSVLKTTILFYSWFFGGEEVENGLAGSLSLIPLILAGVAGVEGFQFDFFTHMLCSLVFLGHSFPVWCLTLQGPFMCLRLLTALLS